MYKPLDFKIMKTSIFLIVIASTAGLLFTSCNKENAKPEVTITELGYENSKIGYAGTDLHIEAEIFAEAKVDKITIEIHHEGEHGDEHEEKSALTVLHEDEWEVDTTFNEFSGMKNPEFHKHLDIPVYAEVGHYHFHFIVTDMEGQQTTVEEEIEIQQPSDDFSASINVGAAQDNNITPKNITGDIAWQSANYYILVKCKDAFGGNWTFSSQYPIVINY